MPSYRIVSAQDRPPLRRRASGLALAFGVNLLLLLALLGLGVRPQVPRKPSDTITVELVANRKTAASGQPDITNHQRLTPATEAERTPKPPRIVLPSKSGYA